MQSRRSSIVSLALLFLGALLLGCWFHWPALTDTYVIHDDVRQSLNWMGYSAPQIFDQDLLFKYAQHNRTTTLNLLYKLGSTFADPLLLTKLFAVFFFALSITVFFVSGQALHNSQTGLLSCALFIVPYNYFHFSSGGFSHGLFMPMIALTVWAMQRRRYWFFLFLLPLEAMTIPMAGFFTGVALCLETLFADLKQVLTPSYWRHKGGYLLAGALAALAFLLHRYASPPEWYGTLLSRAEMIGRPEFYFGGRYPALPSKGYLTEFSEEISLFFLLSLSFFSLTRPLERLRPSLPLFVLLPAGLICYLLADHFFLRLYFPNRYLEYTMPVFLVLYLSSQYSQILDRVRDQGRRILLAGFVVIVAFLIDTPDISQGINTKRVDHPALYEFLATLPEDALIAAPPNTADNIPVFARRRVLVNYELSHPWADTYWQEIQRRTKELYRGYFSDDLKEFLTLSQREGITHWVVRPDFFEQHDNPGYTFYFKPFNTMIHQMIAGRSHFVLAKACQDDFLFHDDKYCVLATEHLRQLE